MKTLGRYVGPLCLGGGRSDSWTPLLCQELGGTDAALDLRAALALV